MVIDLALKASAIGIYYAVVTLDVSDTFNSANWDLIKGTLAKPGVSDYLPQIIESEKLFWSETDEGPNEYLMTADVPRFGAASEEHNV